jgi:hypothetical protein
MRTSQGVQVANFAAGPVITTSVNTSSPTWIYQEAFNTSSYPSPNNPIPAPVPQLSSYWEEQDGAYAIAAGNAVGQSALNIAALNGINVADDFAQAQMAIGAGQYGGLTLRYRRNVNGTWTQLTSASLSGVLNTGSGTLKFSATGTNLQLFWQPTAAASATLVASATDSALTSGSVGMRVSQGVATQDFIAGGE